ncbi:putative hydrolase of the HAD superfamily [Galdieria sulphuraria]|uniref:Putative hydrolase of the HAD superfamily n=1 Tax=Galdieria sulphuraria TaxID=130081 RepID=M2VS21_GALSU|nr:putative hydrolase of the HAD superfamily [Galdieria sulphuraria]EME25896.1 putative hydrolase of the HAD superfamily [Galdieria sulphuraria]|eukprot:XP_005702416.1 putative hydrolase of the HAD superfamily [Galdieria sulphuraria]
MGTGTGVCQTDSVETVDFGLDNSCAVSSANKDSLTLRKQLKLQGVEALFFDCDDTLYPSSCKVSEQVRKNIQLYMKEKLQIPDDKVLDLQHSLFVEYGTTLRGLQELYAIDPYEYWSYIHWSLDYESLIKKDSSLRNILHSLPFRKFVFTNADKIHAQKCLQALDIPEETFEKIIDVVAVGFKNKPDPNSFLTALKIANVDNPSKALLFDDSVVNLQAAKNMGWHVVAVGNSSVDAKDFCDAWIPSIHHVPCILSK